MILSTIEELRLHIPSNAIDQIASLSGIIDNSEHDFLEDKLGTPLYSALCDRYSREPGEDHALEVTGGTYTADPWAVLLFYAQRMVANDAFARFAYQQVLSVNGAGINVASSNDYDAASEKLLDKGVQGYRKEAMVSLNNLLILLEGWAEKVSTPMTIDDDTATAPSPSESDRAIADIVNLWQQSNYYYAHADLLIPNCRMLQRFIDIYDNRDKFIRLLPDLHFIQDEYITDVIGEDTLTRLLHSADNADKTLLRKTRRLMVAYLEERTTILDIDKQRRQRAHDEAVSLKASILALLKAREEDRQSATASSTDTPDDTPDKGYKNNQPGSKMFVSPMLY